MKAIKAAVLGGLLVLGSAAQTGSAAAAAEPEARLTLSVATASGSVVSTELTCGPDGGTHPRPLAACAALRAVGGQPERLLESPPTGACIGLYDPRTARITGEWQGRAISWEQTFFNECVLRTLTGPLFLF